MIICAHLHVFLSTNIQFVYCAMRPFPVVFSSTRREDTPSVGVAYIYKMAVPAGVFSLSSVTEQINCCASVCLFIWNTHTHLVSPSDRVMFSLMNPIITSNFWVESLHCYRLWDCNNIYFCLFVSSFLCVSIHVELCAHKNRLMKTQLMLQLKI